MSGIGSTGEQMGLLSSLCNKGASQSNGATLTITALAVGISVAGVFLLLAALQVLPSGQNVISRLGVGGIVAGSIPMGVGIITLICVIAQKLRAETPPPIVMDPIKKHKGNFRIKARENPQPILSSTHSQPAGATASVVAQWENTYSHYVAYEILDKDITTVLSRGYLAPEEHHHRTSREIPLLAEEEVKCLKDLEAEIDQAKKPTDNGEGLDDPEERGCYIGLGLALYESLKPMEQNWRAGSDLPNLKPKEMRFYWERQKGAEVRNFIEKLEEIGGKYSVPYEAVLLAYDQSKPDAERFDRKMAIYFEEVCQRRGIKTYYDPNESLENRRLYRELVLSLENARVSVFQRRLVAPSISATEKQIHWKDKRVIILHGDAADQIAYKRGVVGEVHLLNPWQHKGSFALIPFNDPKTLILGPRAILEPFVKKNPALQIAYLEDMTPEQCADFQVPQHLRAQHLRVS